MEIHCVVLYITAPQSTAETLQKERVQKNGNIGFQPISNTAQKVGKSIAAKYKYCLESWNSSKIQILLRKLENK